MSETDELSERLLLFKKIEYDEGTLEEQEEWLARLQALDPYFWQSDHMLQLVDLVQLKRRVQVLREQFDTPPTREQLVALVQSIDYSKSDVDIDDLEARSRLFAQSVPHPSADELVNRVWSEKDMTAEEVVDAALSWKVPDLFCLSGPVGENSVSSN